MQTAGKQRAGGCICLSARHVMCDAGIAHARLTRVSNTGVASGLLPVNETLERVEKALSLFPALAVIGVAGPGDPLASGHALEALTIVNKKYPELILCMSTNGLRLPQYAEQIREAGITAVTVTINAVDPAVLQKIVKYPDCSELIENQLDGVKRIAGFAAVKINSVLIPGVNDRHVIEVAKMAASAGADIQNIIPLIPRYELSHIPAPAPSFTEYIRDKCAQYIPQYRNCAHCRADACGIPGKRDLSDMLAFVKVENTFSHG